MCQRRRAATDLRARDDLAGCWNAIASAAKVRAG